MLIPGTILQGRYQIIRLLGQGGFGAVYLAFDLRLSNHHVVVKENQSGDPIQFLQEATMLANLSHSNLPRVTDHFTEAVGLQYLVMDYVEGQNLEQIVEQNNRALAEANALGFMSQVFHAVEYLHANCIIHRDIKPQNIIITPQGKAVLVDFGIAKIHATSTLTNPNIRYLGTPGYAPPEQYTGGTDERSDVYALGATLYYLTTRTVPVEAPNRASGMTIKSPHQSNPKISLFVSCAIMRAMNLSASKRFDSVKAFEEALNRKWLTPASVLVGAGVAMAIILLISRIALGFVMGNAATPTIIERVTTPQIVVAVAPTIAATTASKVVPTIAPTTAPTVAPTIAPTILPTIVPTPTPDPAYSNLINHYTQMCLAALPSPDGHVVQQPCAMKDNQRWKISTATGDLQIQFKYEYPIVFTDGSLISEIAWGLGNLGGESFMRSKSNSLIWTLEPVGNYGTVQAQAQSHKPPPHFILQQGDYFRIKRGNRCVDVDSWNLDNPGHIVLDTCRTGDFSNQVWALYNPPY